MSSPQNTMRPASGASMPEIWLISVVLPAPFGPITACSSPGRTSSVTSSVTRRPPKFLARLSMRKTASTTVSATDHSPQLGDETDQAAAREQRDQHQQGAEDRLPVLGEAGEPFLREDERRSADDRAVQRAHAAENHHDQELAGALPRHV